MKTLIIGLLMIIFPLALEGAPPKVVLLWPGGAPGALGNGDQDRPSLTIFLPDAAKAVGAGVVICPGGGYQMLAMEKEGYEPARWLNSLGMAAFVLTYRLGPRYHYPAETDDGLRAVRYVRYYASSYGIKSDRIGVWGFSAGGHLASFVGTHFDSGVTDVADPIERSSSRPDFMVLAYAVIAFDTPYAHRGSLENLLGERPSAKLVRYVSSELHVTPQTPPTFLFTTDADTTVPDENSILFYMAMRKNHVRGELHVFQPGSHGVGLASTDATLSLWPPLLANWFREQGLLKSP
jgi:acetyl esterase/lipase